LLLSEKGAEGKKAAATITMLMQRKDEHCKNTNMFLGSSQLFTDFYFLWGGGSWNLAPVKSEGQLWYEY
jgi:hypothetical protein